jgi:nucleoside-diphosphate-sugar epimerase
LEEFVSSESHLQAYRGVGVVVTGASGFIGRWVARLLTSAGARLYLVSRDEERMERVSRAYGINGEIIARDLTQEGAFRQLCSDVRPEITFNLAAHGVAPDEHDAELARVLNDTLVGEIAEAMATERNDGWPGARLVHAGSALEYGPVDGEVYEELEPAPTTLYGRTKLAGSNRLLQSRQTAGLRATVARIFTAYGPGEQSGRLLPSLIAAGKTTDSIDLTAGAQRRDFTYVADIAQGMLRLGQVEGALDGVVNLATGELRSVRQFIETASDLIGIPRAALKFGTLPYREEEMWHGPVKVRRLERLTGWRPTTGIDEGIQNTLAFEAV